MKKQKLVVSFPSYKLGTFHKPFVEPGRNAPCPCKSGKKYKNCCLKKLNDPVSAKCVDVSKRNTGYTPPRPPATMSYRKGESSISISPAPAPCTNAPASSIPTATASLLRRGFRKGMDLIKKGAAPEVKP